jgi:hypothetical protein
VDSGALPAALLGLLAAVASVAVYRKVLNAYFWNDDFVWMYLLHDTSLPEVLFTPLGGHTLVARNAVFALVHALAGLDPRPYFATTLVTHAVNVLLLCRLVWLLTGSAAWAGLGALAWGICPAASETLAWYSVYAQVAALTCLLLALDRMAARAREADVLSSRDLVVVATWLGLASVFFGSAIAVALVLPVTIALLFPGMLASRDRVRAVLAVSVVVFVLHGALHLLALRVYAAPAVHADALRWLAHNTGLALLTFVHLVRVGVTSLVLGSWWSPGQRFSAISWITLFLVAVGWLAAISVAPSKARARLLAFTLLGLANYVLVALSRGPMAEFLRTTPTELGGTLRYHYTAQAFLVAAFCVALDTLTSRRRPWAGPAVAGACAGLLIAGYLHYGISLDLHAASRSEVTNALATLRAQVAAAPPGDTVYLDNRPLAAFGWMPNTPISLPGLAALFVIVSPSDELDGRRVRFVERNPAVYQHFTARPDSRLADLLVPVPPAARGQAEPSR